VGEHSAHGSELTSRRVTVDGDAVAYAQYGDPDGDPVVFFHGTPGSRRLGALFEDAARATGTSLLAFDRPGYGQSAPRRDHSPTDTAALVSALLDDAGHESARLVSFSGGAPHALAPAVAEPELVQSVDVVAGAIPPAVRESTPAPQRLLGALAGRTPRALGGLFRLQTAVARTRPPSFVAAQYTADGTEHVPDDALAVVKRDFREALSNSRNGAVREFAQSVENWPFDPAAVDCEVRWVHGARDDNVPLAGVRRLCEQLPNCELTVLDADHLGALVESREQVLDAQSATATDPEAAQPPY
jgi:pimeloyl-ACP methyl ester carboxylesterase